MLPEFTSLDIWHPNDGARPPVYMINGVEGLDPRTLADTDVIIDGRRMRVWGVETWAIVDPTGTSFGLLAEPAAVHFGYSVNDLVKLQAETNTGDRHLLATDDQGFCLAHTDRERSAGTNTPDCPIHQALIKLDAPPRGPGLFIVVRSNEPPGFELFDWVD